MPTDAWFWLWIVLAAVLAVAEIFTSGFFLLPFGIGAGAAAVLTAFGVGVVWQWAAFIGVTVISLFLLRRFARRVTDEPPIRTGAERLVGATGIVTQELGENGGMIRVEREEWRADAPGCGPVAVGVRVKVSAVDGTHLIVSPESPSSAPECAEGEE